MKALLQPGSSPAVTVGASLYDLAVHERKHAGPLDVTRLRTLAEARGDAASVEALDALLKGHRLRWGALKRTVRLLSLTGDHELYERVLLGQDADISFPAWTAAIFKGSGLGGGSFDVYRRLDTGEDVLFEKIYSRTSRDLQRSLWFHRHVLPDLSAPPFTTPALRKSCKGRRLVLQYQTHHDLPKQMPKADVPDFAIELTRYFLAQPPPRGLRQAPASTRNFTLEANYATGRKHALAFLAEQDCDEAQTALATMEAAVVELPHALAHGDINSPNLFRNRLLLDWDRSGYYPLGYDMGFSLSRSMKLARAGTLEAFLHDRVLPYLAPHQREDFLRGCLYFALIFYSRRFEIRASDAFLLELWELCLARFGLSPEPSRRRWWRLGQ